MRSRVVIYLTISLLILAVGCTPSGKGKNPPSLADNDPGSSGLIEAMKDFSESRTTIVTEDEDAEMSITEEEPDAKVTEIPLPESNIPSSPSAPSEEGEKEPIDGDSQNNSPESSSTSDQLKSQPAGSDITPGEEGSNLETTTQECVDKAAFFEDVTVPDDTVIRQGETFEKVWRVRNEGTCIWGEGYALVFAGGENMDGPLSNPIPVIAPMEIANVSVILRAPLRGGAHVSKWEFQNAAGKRFGVGASGKDIIFTRIIVNYFTDVVSTPPADNTCPAEQNFSYENEIISLVNEIRMVNGLNPLEKQDQLAASALKHSLDMACNNFTNHTGSDSSTWYDRVRDQGYANYNSARENILWGNVTPQDAFDWWMNSTDHRNNILYPDVGQIGVGYVYNSNSVYGGYFTMVVARP